MSREISLRTVGRCFLCLLPSASAHPGKGEDPGGRLFSLQSLCRHLELRVDKIVGCPPGNGGPVGRCEGRGDMSSLVPLCGRCGQSYLKFMDFFHTKELIEMELEHLVRSMRGWMVGAAETELRIFKRLMGGQSGGWERFKIVEELREKIIQKSDLKLLQTKPAVKLNELKLEKGVLFQKTLISTFPPLDTAPPSALDSTKCNVKVVQDEDQYDDDNDDIPVPMLEIVKLEPPDDVRAEPSQYDDVDGEVMIEANTDTDIPEPTVPVPASPPDGHQINGEGASNSTEDVHNRMEAENDNETDPLWEPEIPSNNLNSDNEDDESWTPSGNYRPTSRAPKRRFPASQKNAYMKIPEGKKVRCKLCPRQFASRTSWQVHYDSIHLGVRYKCDICSSNFTQECSMKKHRKTCDGRRRTPSPVQVASSSGVVLKEKPRQDSGKIGAYAKHYFQNEAGKYVCALCQREYANSNSFYAHFRTVHIKIRRQCKDCGKTFTQNCTLTKHKVTCKGKPRPAPDLKYLCKRCGKGFSTPAWLKEHEERVHLGIKYSCDVCLKSYSYKHCLTRHSCAGPPTSEPSNGSTSNSATAPVNRFNCKWCGKEFQSYVHYRGHCRKTFMKIQQRCLICVTTFSHDCGLHLHNKGKCEGNMISLDPEKDMNHFECLECGNKFTSKGGLLTHRESVHQGAVFRCDLCNKPFTNMANVRRHRRSCDSHPSSKSAIVPLYSKHEPFKPRRVMRKADGTYECEHCQEKFDSSQKLIYHKKTVHLGIKFKCGKCKITVSSEGYLRVHRRRYCPASNSIPGGPHLKTKSSISKVKGDEIEEPISGSYGSHCRKGKEKGEVICNLCKRSFATNIGFKLHYQSIHQGIPHQYRCKICSKTFPKKADLVEHKKEDKCSGTVGESEEEEDGDDDGQPGE